MKFLLLLLALTLLTGCAPQPVTQAASLTEIPETAPPSPAQPLPTEAQIAATQPPPDPLRQLLESMTLEERVGQLFLARCPAENALEDLSAYHLGGYILFARDFQDQTPLSLQSTLRSYQEQTKLPLLIAVDEEGGSVCRVSLYPAFREQKFASPRTLYGRGGMDALLAEEAEKAALLQELGINVNMAPVCDITTQPGAFMYQRSLGASAEITSDFIRGTVDIMDTQGIGSVLKHFPGYGNCSDTHTGIIRDTRSLSQLKETDLVPFQAGIDAGCGAILVSHVIAEAFDKDNPATLSPEVHRYLREEMGFEGVIVTDDLVMGAITERYGPGESAVLAVLAGNDLLCSTDYAMQFEAVLDAVYTGRISIDILNDACMRVLAWKQELGLLF